MNEQLDTLMPVTRDRLFERKRRSGRLWFFESKLNSTFGSVLSSVFRIRRIIIRMIIFKS